jgi:hypothetical protein
MCADICVKLLYVDSTLSESEEGRERSILEGSSVDVFFYIAESWAAERMFTQRNDSLYEYKLSGQK